MQPLAILVARRRLYRRPWVLAPAALASLVAQAGLLLVYELARPEPKPRLIVELIGDGEGKVVSLPAGIDCGSACSASFETGDVVQLTVITDEGSTFGGWDGCEMDESLPSQCRVTLDATVHVKVELGLVPDAVEVAWQQAPEAADEELTVTLPEPEIEAERLLEPVAVVPPPPKPSPPPEPPPEAPREQAPPPPPVEQENLKSVEVADENLVEDAPNDARFLSDKNRDVAEETRATETNLERAQQGEQAASSKSDISSEEVGAEEEQIAQLEDIKAAREFRASEARTNAGEAREQAAAGEGGEGGDEGQEAPQKKGALSMRGIEGRGGLIERPRSGDPGKRGKKGSPGLKTQLDMNDYERIVGKDQVASEREVGRRQKSARRGRWEKKLGAIKSSLENFTPEVRPGNQTALKTRAAPFAVYLARMHQSIHERWGFGFLEDLASKRASHPLNNPELMVQLEIVVNADGSLHKTTIVRTSGLSTFDVAAIDVIYSSAPFEPPPEVIRSPDGRAYMHWGFYRNERQCGTFNAEPFILSKAPAEKDGDSRGWFPDSSTRRSGSSSRGAQGP